MNRNRKYIGIIATLLLTSLFSATAIPISQAAKKPKSAGRTSSTISNTILNGKGAPLSTLGINGDFYIDTRSLLIYGPKRLNKWPLPQSLQGPTGADGKNGSEGKTISNATAVTGPVGSQGEKGDKGEKGETGSAGASGAPGLAGLAGAKGDTGASGGGGGTTGATGPQGAQGPVGSTGAIGAKGETGTVGSNGVDGVAGAIGPSNVYTNSISGWNLSTSSAGSYSTSTFFLNFKSGKNYLYSIYLVGQSEASGGIFAVEIIHSDGSTSKYGYSVVEKNNFSWETKSIRYTFTITGVISPVGGDVGVAIRIIDDLGVTGSTNAMSLSGIAFSTLVGAVGTL